MCYFRAKHKLLARSNFPEMRREHAPKMVCTKYLGWEIRILGKPVACLKFLTIKVVFFWNCLNLHLVLKTYWKIIQKNTCGFSLRPGCLKDKWPQKNWLAFFISFLWISGSLFMDKNVIVKKGEALSSTAGEIRQWSHQFKLYPGEYFWPTSLLLLLLLLWDRKNFAKPDPSEIHSLFFLSKYCRLRCCFPRDSWGETIVWWARLHKGIIKIIQIYFITTNSGSGVSDKSSNWEEIVFFSLRRKNIRGLDW